MPRNQCYCAYPHPFCNYYIPPGMYYPTPQMFPNNWTNPSSTGWYRYPLPATHHYPIPACCSHGNLNNGSKSTLSDSNAYRWVDADNKPGGVPATAVLGGYDTNGKKIYVGRSFHNGHWIPAKVIPDEFGVYIAVPYNGKEYGKEKYQVLCQPTLEWVKFNGENILENAVKGGETTDGQPLYIGRAHHCGSLTVGKVDSSTKILYIPFGNEEHEYTDFEILVLKT